MTFGLFDSTFGFSVRTFGLSVRTFGFTDSLFGLFDSLFGFSEILPGLSVSVDWSFCSLDSRLRCTSTSIVEICISPFEGLSMLTMKSI